MARARKKVYFWGKQGVFPILLQCVFWFLVWHSLEIPILQWYVHFFWDMLPVAEMCHWNPSLVPICAKAFGDKGRIYNWWHFLEAILSPPGRTEALGLFHSSKVSAPCLTPLPRAAQIDKGGLSCSVFCPHQRCPGSSWTALGNVKATDFFSASVLQLLCSFCSTSIFLCFPQVV